MYDTIYFKFWQRDFENIDFIKDILPILSEWWDSEKFPGVKHGWLYGAKGGNGMPEKLFITITKDSITIKNSLCKWYLGDNFQSMNLVDIQIALKQLSRIFNLPFEKAVVTRLDIAFNLTVKYSVDIYLSHLGEMKYSKRVQSESTGIYYHQSNGTWCIYDKIKSQRVKRQSIPELYKGRNCIRIEHRYLRKLPSTFNVEKITGALLCDEEFYHTLCKQLIEDYRSIRKINDVDINFKIMKKLMDFRRNGLLDSIERNGGQIEVINQIKDAQKRKDLTAKQAYELKKEVEAIYNNENGFACQSEAIIELDRKVGDAMKYQF